MNINSKTLLSIFFLVSINLSSQKISSQEVISKEQIALNYFFDKIFSENYKEKICKMEFSNYTEKDITYFGIYEPCFDKDLSENLFINFKNEKKIERKFLKIDINYIQFKKNKQKYRLNVFKVNTYKNLHYVQLEITKKKEFTDAYFLVINKDNEVVDWCKKGLKW